MKRNSAFTLVELAIVVVIIGLLTGGVLAGRELVEQSKMTALIKEIKSFESAVLTFKSKYGFLPGDLPNATNYWPASSDCMNGANVQQTCNGDGDTTIDYEWSGVTNAPWETRRSFQHLGLAKLIKGTYTGASSTSCAGGSNCYIPEINSPGSSYGNSKGYVMWTSNGINPVTYDSGLTYLIFANLISCPTNPAWGGRWHCPSITPENQRQIDIKMDDGRPYLGVLADINMAGGNNFSPNCTTNDINETAEYNLSNNNEACMLIYKMKY